MNKRPAPVFIHTDAEGFAQIAGRPALVVLQISRQEIESCNYTSSLERLMVMTDSRENTLRYREALILQITGYDADPRELAEILEVRKFFASLTNEWPNWFWFLTREQGMVSLVMSLLCKVKVHRNGGAYGIEFIDSDELSQQVGDLLERGLVLMQSHDIDPSDAEASAISAVRALTGE